MVRRNSAKHLLRTSPGHHQRCRSHCEQAAKFEAEGAPSSPGSALSAAVFVRPLLVPDLRRGLSGEAWAALLQRIRNGPGAG